MKVSEEFIERIAQNQGIVLKICRVYCNNQDDRQDLFQEIMLQVWKSYASFQSKSKFSTWLYRVALNTAIAHLNKRTKAVPTDGLEGRENAFVYSTDDPTADEDIARMYKAISHLSEVEKALVMLYLEEHSYAEMEEILGINANSLRVKMSRVKDKLKQIMEGMA